jgi:hypothetical protein
LDLENPNPSQTRRSNRSVTTAFTLATRLYALPRFNISRMK